MHISDQVAAELTGRGFVVDGGHFAKRLPTGGEFGFAKVFVTISDDGRWLSKVDGWGAVEKDCDLREFSNAAKAIGAVLN